MSIPDMIEGTQYNMSLTIFFISYALFEPLTNALLKRLTPRIFFTCIILAWGSIMTLMGLVTNYQGLLAARFMLGIAEAGLFPGMCRPDCSTVLLSANFHRRHILPVLLVQEL
jgi:MFS family permease